MGHSGKKRDLNCCNEIHAMFERKEIYHATGHFPPGCQGICNATRHFTLGCMHGTLRNVAMNSMKGLTIREYVMLLGTSLLVA